MPHCRYTSFGYAPKGSAQPKKKLDVRASPAYYLGEMGEAEKAQSIGAMMVARRWAKTTAEERKALGRRLTAIRLRKQGKVRAKRPRKAAAKS